VENNLGRACHGYINDDDELEDAEGDKWLEDFREGSLLVLCREPNRNDPEWYLRCLNSDLDEDGNPILGSWISDDRHYSKGCMLLCLGDRILYREDGEGWDKSEEDGGPWVEQFAGMNEWLGSFRASLETIKLKRRIKKLEAELVAAAAGGAATTGRKRGRAGDALTTVARTAREAKKAAAAAVAACDAMAAAVIDLTGDDDDELCKESAAAAGGGAAAVAAPVQYVVYAPGEQDMPPGVRIDLDGPEGNPVAILSRLLREYPGMKTTIEGMLQLPYEKVVRTASMMLGKTKLFTKDQELAKRINSVA